MKVLLTADCVGGVWTYALQLISGLAAAGHEVVLAVMGPDLQPDQRAELDAAPLAYWEARPYRLEWMQGDPTDDLDRAGEWLLELFRTHHPEVVHLNQFSHAALEWDRPVVVVAHSDVVTWWRAVHGRDPDASWSDYRSRVETALQRADVVVAPTRAMLSSLTEAYATTAPARVIHNGRDLRPAGVSKEPVIASAGRVWDEAKNVRAAVQAAQSLPWRLIVAGAGEPTEGAEFLGRVSPAATVDLLSRASIFVEPARYEPFGLAALEAALTGCALVLGDIPSLREVWADAAVFVPPDDVAALRAVLLRLIDEPAALKERQEAARRRAQRYGVAAMTEAYIDTYQSLLPAPAPQAAS